jgi:tetratricopeptide (TPR) repeat protein
VGNFLTRVKVRWWLFMVARKRKHEQYAEALEIVHKVIAVQPLRAVAFLQAGYCLGKLHRHEEALHSYERALEIAPNYGEAHAYMALAYYDLGRNREALESLNRATRMKPSVKDDPYWLHMFGLASGNAEQWEQSLAAFTELTESNPKNANAWHGLGWALAHMNRESED